MVSIRQYEAPPVNVRELLRYAGGGDPVSLEAPVQECLHEAAPLLSYRACYTVLPLTTGANGVELGGLSIASADLAKCLKNCTRAVVFAATVGAALDRLIARYGTASPAKALLLDALGSERIEALCDLLCADLEAEHGCLTPRFSPGYGDLTLAVQQDIFRILEPARRIGLSLNGSLLMTPSKSVTAIVGIKENNSETNRISQK